MKTNIKTAARLDAALAASYLRKFRNESCDATRDAQRNLEGRTHYADAETLRHFSARILESRTVAGGLLFYLIESVSSRPENKGRTRRAVVFDIFGTVVNDRAKLSDSPDGGKWHKTTDAARREIAAFLETFDATAHTAAALATRCRQEVDRSRRTLAALAGRATA